jgi:hypothetical protein
MRKVIVYTLLVLLILVLVVVVVALSNPLRKSEARIRENILALTPIGTGMEDVIKVIENNKKWEINHINYESGYGIDKDGRPGENRNTRIGEKSIRVYLGSYRNIFETGVLVYFGFDENSKLIDAAVRKDTDGF